MLRRAILVAVGVFATSAATALGAGSGNQWSKISGDGVSSIQAPSLALDGADVVGAWIRTHDGAIDAEVTTFHPTSGAAGRGPTTVAASPGWVALGPPRLLGRPGGGLQLMLSGIHSTNSGDPLNTTSFAPRNPDGSFGPPVPTGIGSGATSSSAVSAILGPDGQTTFFVITYGGSLTLYRGAVNPTSVDVLAATGSPGPITVPTLGRDTAGRLWIAWYQFTQNNAGLRVQQIDPATGAPQGGPLTVPASASGDNNATQLAFACASTCRIVYLETGANGASTNRILSWAPGDPSPSLVAKAGQVRDNLAAAYRADGRLWTLWFDKSGKGSYKAVLGDDRGAGGQVQDLGTPPLGPGNVGLPSTLGAVAAGNNLVAVADWIQGGGNAVAQWATVLAPPSAGNPAVPDTTGIANPVVTHNGPALLVAPKRVSLRSLKRSKCVKVRVQSTRPARVGVAIFSGIRSIRVFGRAEVVFRAAGKRVVCVRVPLKAHTFDVRQPFRFAFAVAEGAKPRKGEGRPREVTQVFTFLK
jgi:hypothetical protein